MNSSGVSTTDGPLPAPPSYSDIVAAADRLAGKAILTPLLESQALNARVGGRVLIKPEILQRTGSFKFRGAYNRISQIPPAQRAAGVVSYSSGNHAQGVAAAAALFDMPATIVMPADAPAIKIANTRGYGATVELYERASESREARAKAIAAELDATIVCPYDDADVMAGQGTCGLEIARQAEQLNAQLDALLVCCGGGGLTSGCAIALAEMSPDTKVYAVEPEGFDDTKRSLEGGERVANAPGHDSFCDALLSPTPGALTFSVNRRLLAGGIAVSDDEVAAAMAYAFSTLKLVVEPGGAVSLAALLAGKIDARDKTLALTLTGGNVDPDTHAKAVAAGSA
jgi:threonine dehydratase